jgi:uncharacterized membrane protein
MTSWSTSTPRTTFFSRASRPNLASMPDIAIARALHVLAVVLWIGGVGLVTTVLLPLLRKRNATLADFHALERPFARQARVLTLLAGASGFYMAWRMDAWDRFRSAGFWWMHAMVLTWLVFTAMLFIIEPLFLERLLACRSTTAPEQTFRLVEWLHRVLLGLSLLTVAGAVAGTWGVNLFAR